ncbi:MAG TPA: DUF6232 family protein [Candidatus Acidoferrales bacterium]|nr:DUF6232 family protein [Candidatus Acidoferrales bacterium]
MSGDAVFYSDERGIKVAGSSVTVDNIAYPIANLTYVAARVERPSRIVPFFVIAVGFSLLVEKMAQRSFGVAMLAGIVAGMGVFLLRESKPVHCIDLAAVAGKGAPVVRGTEERITAIAKAINETIVHRLSAPDVASLPFEGDSEASVLSLHS